MSLRPSGCSRPPSLSLRALRSKARQSRGTHSEHREAFGEIAGACLRFPRRFAPRNDKSEVRAILVMAGTYRQRLQCPLSHLRGQLSQRESQGRFAPRNDNSGAVTILTEACFARQCAAGPGCPRPYSALSMSAQKFINYSASLKYAASSCILLSSNGEVRLPSCSMARNVDSGAAYSRSLKAFRPAPGVSCSSW